MPNPRETFEEICKSRQLPLNVLTDVSVSGLATLALEFAEYAVPVFAAYKHMALPIASEWILSSASTSHKSAVFCRLALLSPLWPPLQPLTEHFLEMNKERGYVSNILEAEDKTGVLIGVLKLLLHDYGRFAHYFSAEALRTLAAEVSGPSRALALQTLGVLMQVSESVVDAWLTEFTGEDSTELQFETIFKAARQSANDANLFASTDLIPATEDYENFLVTTVENVCLPRFGYENSSALSFVPTRTASENVHRLALNLLRDRPLLIKGAPGSGKTFFTEVLHSRVRPNSEIVRIHLGDQTDAKSLIGTYTSGTKPGTFEWSPGALLSAVKAGKWVLVEDIDRAPTDVAAVLLPLIDRRELVVPSRNEVIKAAPGFQLVSTTTSDQIDVIGGRGWLQTGIVAPTHDDLIHIIFSKSPFLAQSVISMLADTFTRVQDFQDTHKLVRRATARDLFKLVARITPRYDNDDLFRETVACFTSFLAESTPLARAIADSMGIATSKIDFLLRRHKPILTMFEDAVVIGRAMVERRSVSSLAARNSESQLQDSKFALTGPTLQLLEEVAVSVAHSEPVLLVGETGTGKTSVVQYLAQLVRRKLVVINVSQQVEAGDLVGGFKPVDARQLAGPLLEEFNELFESTFSRAKNHQFLSVLERAISRQQWSHVIKLLREAVKMATPQHQRGEAKRQKVSGSWAQFTAQIASFEKRIKEVNDQAQFQFIEGLLIKAMRQGHWVLLDEVNLAPADTLEGISELVSSRSLTLLEQSGDVVHASPDFQLFANMNPATDVGKRDLPPGVRSHFTELWSHSPDSDPDALRTIISGYLPQGTQPNVVNDVADLFMDAKRLEESHQLVDGAGQRPHFSIRTLSRALVSAVAMFSRFGLRRALYEAFNMCFLTLLDEASMEKLNKVIDSRILDKIPNRNSALSQVPAMPNDGYRYIQFHHWWMPVGQFPPEDDPRYIITPSVDRNLLNLVRATATKMFPILIQGPTSSGKTSMITHLAKRSGHVVVRINNHEHTDLAEYLGGYESDSDGRLVFREGALVTALREGQWLILDELNLAPTDVLEALNRLLDDNRELLIPETQEVVKPHPNFILFATQNPPGIYAGRKALSRAFRNRFLELHFGEIPESELEIILRERSHIAPSYAAKIVEAYRELGRRRSGSRVFEQPATLRDLFRWATRPAIGYEQLAQNGMALLGERARTEEEREIVRSVLSDVMRVPVDTDYSSMADESIMAAAPENIVWTSAMKRVLALVRLALNQNEPVLLVGETGSGKTTIVQALAAASQQKLTILNAHQNTETGDLVGSQRPSRLSSTGKLFEWMDGPLLASIKNGDFFLLDEISLADDSVLERLNSVLETERTIFVPEVGSFSAADGFQFLATMNPGGDYGKKELSPALRNRFTEIWVPSVDNENDLQMIVRSRLTSLNSSLLDKAVSSIVAFTRFFSSHYGLVSLRDVLSWTQFLGKLGISEETLIQGAFMVFIDGLGSNAYAHLAAQPEALIKAKTQCESELERLTGVTVDVNNAEVKVSEDSLEIGGFRLPRGSQNTVPDFSFSAPTSALNAMRVMRALQLKKPVLLEGSPGAGKTSLVAALAEVSGNKLTRINLSDQTDLADLFGSDIPLDEPGKFGWRDAPFLRAMQKGEWVLLDEMNLAPQQVLEGLNAALDHRGEVYIPELDRTFVKHPNFIVFAAQNPHAQGGGRKGLPKSFVNRFSVVYVEQLGQADLRAIAASAYPLVDATTRDRLTDFVEEISRWTASRQLLGGPFEFNLRDTMRWLDLIESSGDNPSVFLNAVVLQRFRTESDRNSIRNIFEKFFALQLPQSLNPVQISPDNVCFGSSSANRSNRTYSGHNLAILSDQIPILETALSCIGHGWPLILVGPSGAGKTSVIRLVAQLCGARLHEFAMTADIDSTDLLGEFDQMEQESERQRLWAEFDDLIAASDISDARLLDTVRRRDMAAAVDLLPEGHELLDHFHEFSARDFSKPTFQWVDGMLVKAIELGHWIVLDNANLCSPAVLDRLNSLLERGGKLLVNECAEADGSPREITPHPNFRLFLTVDPRYGELSRAMRNRGVEVWMSSELHSAYDGLSIEHCTYSAALSAPYFSRPVTAAKLGDLHKKSWLRVLLLDPNSSGHIGTIDSELRDFAVNFGDKLQLRGGFKGGISRLEICWSVFTIQQAMLSAQKVSNISNLLERSALSRRKESVESDFDVFGLISKVADLLLDLDSQMEELASVSIDFLAVKDPSRVPVYRDWFIKFAESHNLPEFSTSVVNMLGAAYDFSEGGSGMDRLWLNYARDLGFSSAGSHETFKRGLLIASDFDKIISQIVVSHIDAVSHLRLEFANVIGSDPESLVELQRALDALSDSLPASISPISGCLTEQFKGLFAAFSLKRTVDPSQALDRTMSRLASFAHIPTEDFHDLITDNRLKAPSVETLPSLESIIIDSIQADVQGAATNELSEVARVFLEQSTAVTEITEPSFLIGEIVTRNARLIAEAVPEALESMNRICSRAISNPEKACIELALALLELYVCPLPLDPAIGQYVWYDRYLRLQTEIEHSRIAWKEICSVFGVNDSEVDLWLYDQELAQVPIPTVYRPKHSSIDQVHRDMVSASNLARSVLKKDLSADEITVLRQNAAHIHGRLSRATEYRDLVSPVRTALNLLTLGLSVSERGSSLGNLWLLDPLVIGRAVPEPLPDYPLLVLQSLATFPKVPLEPLNDVLNDIHRRWALEKLRIEKQRREDAAGFRYDDDDDLAAEREFHMMFPDYEEGEQLPPANDVFAPKLASLHKQIFLSSKLDPVDVAINASYELGSALGRSSRNHLPSLYLAIKKRLSGLSSEGSNLNFYLDSSEAESKVSKEFSSKIEARVRELLTIWPEHDVLKTLSRVSAEIQALPPAVPIALHLAKAEQLHHWLFEWDRFADKTAKVGDLMTEGASIIVRWRRLELSTWPSLFKLERKRCMESNAPFWYHLYETLIFAPSEDLGDTSKILVLFLSEATIGQFDDRLNMLRAFCEHTKLMGRAEIAQCIANVCAFYQQFLPALKQREEVAEKELKKQVDEVVRLASWRDINIHALKQSAQRSHRQLFKAVKKFRALLAEKPSMIISEVHQSEFVAYTKTNWESKWSIKLLAPLEKLASGSTWDERPKHLKDVEKTATVLQTYVEQVSPTKLPALSDFADDVARRAQVLRSETPKTASKDNKKLVANLRVQKQQLLTAVLRELRIAGIRSSIRKDLISSQMELTRVLALSPDLASSGKSLASAEPYFFAFIELLPRLRASVSEAANNPLIDVPFSDLQKGLALTENLFSHLLRLRKVAAKHVNVLEARNLADLFSELSLKPRSAVLDYATAKEASEQISELTLHVLGFVGRVHDEAGTARPNELAAVESASHRCPRSEIQLRSATTIDWVQDIFTKVDSLVIHCENDKGVSALVAGILEGLRSMISQSLSNLKPLSATMNASEDLVGLVIETSSTVLVVVQHCIKVIETSTNVFDSEQRPSEDRDEDDSEWLTKLLLMAEKLLLSLRPHQVYSKLNAALDSMLNVSSSDPELAGAFSALLLPYVRGYQDLVCAVEALFARVMLQTSSGSFKLASLLLSLATEGFCSPQEVDADDENDQSAEGTGLGDGTGAQSSSKDFDEDDDNVSEAMQSANPDQDDRDEAEDGEDNAREVEGDMAGKTEDLPEQSDEDQDKSDQEDDLDPEDMIGDLDELDPNTVDEKMWDHDSKNTGDEKEKQTDEGLKGTQDGDAEARENDKDDQDSGEPGDKDAGDPDGSASEAEDADEQDDDVKSGSKEELMEDVEQKDALDLPEDMELDDPENDGGDEGDEPEADDDLEEGEGMDADFEDSSDQPQEKSTAADPESNETEELPDELQPETAEENAPSNEDEDLSDNKVDADDDAPMSDQEDGADKEVDEPNKDEAVMDVDENTAMPEGDGDGADVEGISGLTEDQSKNQQEQSANNESQSESTGKGASENAAAEDEHLGTGGTSSANADTKGDEEPSPRSDPTNESLRTLSDAFKEFHRRKQSIKEREDHENDTSADDDKASDPNRPLNGSEELEHVGAEDAYDTQALGKTNKAEDQLIDDKLAIDDEEDPTSKDVAGSEEEGADKGAKAGGDAEGAISDEEEEESENGGAMAIANATRMDEPSDEDNEAIDRDEDLTAKDEELESGDTSLWQTYEAKTHDLALILGEQLRLILEPTVASKLRGDYRTGKRLNMKRIIPYIASEFRKDKIWLRRAKPAKREYQILLALDDSRSMGEPAVVDLAFQAIALVGSALSNIEAGQIGIAKFGGSTQFVHELNQPFTPQAGNSVLQQFSFSQERTDVGELLKRSLEMFASHQSSGEQWRLELIVSDGITDDYALLRSLVRKAREERVMLVFVVLDALNKDTSILTMNEVRYVPDEHGNQKLEVTKYMENFAFDYYVIVRNIGDLPMVLASVLRQYFQAVDES